MLQSHRVLIIELPASGSRFAMGYGSFNNIWLTLASLQRRSIESSQVMNIESGMSASGLKMPDYHRYQFKPVSSIHFRHKYPIRRHLFRLRFLLQCIEYLFPGYWQFLDAHTNCVINSISYRG